MFRIKRIDRYVFSSFIGLFAATFFICSLILMMLFLWKHVNELIGKGIETSVLLEFFFYAFLTNIPLTLPLAILLGSLMTFGNLGEKFELTAMKAAGVSLFRIMKILIIFIALVSIGTIYFSNNVLPQTQKKLWTLIFSLRQTQPELDIPVGEFYTGIEGRQFYIQSKDIKRKILKDLMIYDYSMGFNNASVTLADSARLTVAKDRTYLKLELFNGESFENLKKTESNASNANIPYRRETFAYKEVLIDFNINFKRLDEEILKDQHISKNLSELQATIDSVSLRVDSIRTTFGKSFYKTYFFDRQYTGIKNISPEKIQSEKFQSDSAFYKLNKDLMNAAVNSAIEKSYYVKSNLEYQKSYLSSESYLTNKHRIEWHRKFTLSFACLIFFFIGAPLGAIIRKGGLGLPVVISVIMFLVYYIIDNVGYKVARDDVWAAWQGIWLSSAILMPIGLFLTYKAAKDSPILVADAYKNFISKFRIRKKEK